MINVTPIFGQQRYRIANGEAHIVQAIHQLRPEPGEPDAGFLARILADIARTPAAVADLTLYRRDGRIAHAEIAVFPPTPPPIDGGENPL